MVAVYLQTPTCRVAVLRHRRQQQQQRATLLNQKRAAAGTQRHSARSSNMPADTLDDSEPEFMRAGGRWPRALYAADRS